jgi:hypothetical protein
MLRVGATKPCAGDVIAGDFSLLMPGNNGRAWDRRTLAILLCCEICWITVGRDNL